MFNIGGPELLVILLVALIVLGPQRLPDAAKQVGKVLGDLRRLSSGFQQEMRSALDETTEAKARARGAGYKPVDPDAPAVAPVTSTSNGADATPAPAAPQAPAKKAAKKRSAPLRAPRK